MRPPEPRGGHAATGISRCPRLCAGCVAARGVRAAQEMPVIGIFRSGEAPRLLRALQAGFRQGLKGADFVEGQNVAI